MYKQIVVAANVGFCVFFLRSLLFSVTFALFLFLMTFDFAYCQSTVFYAAAADAAYVNVVVVHLVILSLYLHSFSMRG